MLPLIRLFAHSLRCKPRGVGPRNANRFIPPMIGVSANSPAENSTICVCNILPHLNFWWQLATEIGVDIDHKRQPCNRILTNWLCPPRVKRRQLALFPAMSAFRASVGRNLFRHSTRTTRTAHQDAPYTRTARSPFAAMPCAIHSTRRAELVPPLHRHRPRGTSRCALHPDCMAPHRSDAVCNPQRP